MNLLIRTKRQQKIGPRRAGMVIALKKSIRAIEASMVNKRTKI